MTIHDDDGRTWTPRTEAHRDGVASASRSLLGDTLRATNRVSRRYPGAYFELCGRTNESVTSLGHRVFVRLDGRRFGRFPFSDRTPFDAFVADQMIDRDVRWHSFTARLSIAREILREQYAFNVRHHPEWAARDALHKGVVAALKADFPTWPGRSPRYPRFGLAAWPGGPRTVRPDWDRDEIVRIVTRRATWPLQTRIEIVLAKHGAPMYPAAISSVLQDADVASADTSIDPDQLSAGGQSEALASTLSVRQLIAERWRTLSDEEQELLVLLVTGRPYREVVEAIPSLNDPSAVTRTLARICDRFVSHLAEAFGGPRSEGPRLKPKQQAELLFGVLVELPQVRARMEAAG
jgi:hypothetical protein